MIDENKKIVWFGNYDGIYYEINNFKREWDTKDCWTFYLYLHIDKIPNENDPQSFWLKPEYTDKDRIHYDYSNHKILQDIKWHCEMTWYSKETSEDEKKRVIKVGCDYQHYWDEGHLYSIDSVREDVINAVKSFRELIPRYKYWCNWDGKLHLPEEVSIKENGEYSCNCTAEGMKKYKMEQN